jgi:cytochrome c oxidase subunit 2
MKRLGSLLYAALLLGPATALADYKLNLRQGVTPVSHDVYDLHMLVLWLVTIVGIGVFGVMIYSIINHRKSKGAVAAQFHESTTVEVIWTIIPFAILVAIAVPATQTLLKLEDTTDADVDIKVTGWQWKWQYEYLNQKVGDGNLSFFSNLAKSSNEARQRDSGKDVFKVDHYLLDVDKPVVVPVNKKVRLLVTSNDVIHSWFMPDFGVKRDAIPGYINESWFRAEKTGTYRGQCAELCGKDHGFMPIVVKVVTEDEYQDWIHKQVAAAKQAAAASGKTYSKDELVAKGKEIYSANCASCHQPDGKGTGPFPALDGSPIATGKDQIEHHIHRVLHGKGMMPPFGPQLSDLDVAAVVTYERNAWGNHTGDVVQPSDVSAAR